MTLEKMVLSALLAMVTMIGCSKSGLMAANLDRATALALIEKAQQSGKHPVPDTTIHYLIPAEINYIDVRSREYLAQNMPDIQKEMIRRTDQANLDFYRSMVSKGWLREVTPCGSNSDMPITRHCYASTGPSFVETTGWSGSVYGRVFDIVVSRPKRMSVVGVIQNGNYAEAEILVENAPTDVLKELAKISAAVDANFNKTPSPDGSYRPGIPVSSTIPSDADLNQHRTFKVHFAKYDDGWRVAL